MPNRNKFTKQDDIVSNKVLTIAGSDSSAGAGIQSDLKTFTSLGVDGATVITTLTAQNSKKIADIYPVSSKFFKTQLITTLEDINPKVIKIGVVYERKIIKTISEVLKNIKVPIVIDPVLRSGTNIELLKSEDIHYFKKRLLPLSFVTTPNVLEAEKLSGIKIENEKDMRDAAIKVSELGTSNVIIKGGHLPHDKKKVKDIIFKKESKIFYSITRNRLKLDRIHGTGCSFSSSLTAFLAKGYNLDDSFLLANSYVYEGLKNLSKAGGNLFASNSFQNLYEQSEKYKILTELQIAIDQLENIDNFYTLIPETKTNFVYAMESAIKLMDIAGISGRITEYNKKIRSPNIVKFGASQHVANAVIAAQSYNSRFRSAINIKNNDEILTICKKNFICSYYSRNKEPFERKLVEGSTIKWGIKQAFEKNSNSQIIYHSGDYGKEPMILLFATNPQEIINMIQLILQKLKLR